MSDFEWNPKKSLSNLEKHGIDFYTASMMWRGLVYEAETYPGNDEVRFKALGMIDGRHWTVIVTYRKGVRRIISARRSRKEEAELYDYVKGRKEAGDR